MDNDRQSKKDV